MRREALLPLPLLALVLVGCGGEDVSFRWAPGEARTYLRTELSEGRSPDGLDRSATLEFTTTETAVEVIPGTSATLRVVFDRVAGEVHRGGGKPVLRYDSAAPLPAPPEGDAEAAAILRSRAPLLALVGKSIEGTWKPSGLFEKDVGFEGLEEMRAAMTAGRPADHPMHKAVEQIASVPSLHHLLRPHLVVGESSLEIGQPRKFQDMGFLPENVGGIGFFYAAGTYTLKSVEEGVARVELEAEAGIDPLPGMPPWPPALAELRNRLRLVRGTCRGFARIEVATGRLLEDEHVMELDLHFTRPDGKGEVPVPCKATRRLKLIK